MATLLFGGTAPGADLGGSSKYSNMNFEDRSGGGLHVNKTWTWVRRSLNKVLCMKDNHFERQWV